MATKAATKPAAKKTTARKSTKRKPKVTIHPLEPLTEEEIKNAVAIMRKSKEFGEKMRFASVGLNEPPKSVVLAYKPGKSVDREAFMILLDNADGATYEAVVSITKKKVKEFAHIPGVQPAVILDEFFECEEALKNDPEFQEALKKRGITDFDLITVDPWSAGNYGDYLEQGQRIVRALTWVRSEPGDNNYAHPVDGLIALYDSNAQKVIRVEDHQVIPVPQENGNYSQKYVKEFRQDLKPLDITQPDGPSFTVDGHAVEWQKWSFRIGFTHREGLVLYNIGYEDEGKVRPLIYRLSLAEMTVPYGDTNVTQYRKNAFDVGEYGFGMLANSLELGCDCLGEIRYFDGRVCDAQGEVMTIKNAVCMHEEDFSLLWKHTDFRTEEVETRRSRRLVVSNIATVGNYEYGVYWNFYQDGTIELDMKLSGILTTAACVPGETTKYGTMLGDQLYAPNHQHFFCFRMDMALDGQENTVVELNTVADPTGENNPYGNAYYGETTPLKTEQEAQRIIDPFSARYWKITNPNSLNHTGQPVSYKLMPGENTLPFAQPNSSIAKRGGYMWKHLWVTPYNEERRELFPAGDYPNQHAGGDGLPKWTQEDRSVENTDIVVWYVMGHNHLPTLEDWPVMPVANMGFKLRPAGFFPRSAALDVAPQPNGQCHAE
ncbi:MAG: primary-amine oxidase [Chloroflexota bacterium]